MAKSRQRAKSEPRTGAAGEARAGWAWLLIVLGAAVMYAPSLDLPFIGDDYIFLDETRSAGFAQLWSRSHVNFGWYRPWSREFYFWTLQHLAGQHVAAYRAANLLLWMASLLILGKALSRLANPRIALTAVAGTAVLGLWGAPLLWISGSQDLWLVFFLSLTLLAALSQRRNLALLPFACALLSKETAAAIPIILAGVWYFAERCRPREVALRVLPFAGVTVAWLAWHPILMQRLLHAQQAAPSAEPSLPVWQVGIKTTQAMLNIDQLGGAFIPSPVHLAGLAIGALLLALAVRIAGRDRSEEVPEARAQGLARAGWTWAVAGWLPLVMPSVGWHAYYGCIGAIGAWLVIAVELRRRAGWMLALVLLLGTLRLFNSSTESLEWGSDWYQRRAGDLLGRIRDELLVIRPTVPAHSRFYFGGLPNNIGLVAGDSPALRVWYADSTLRGGFYSQYRPRASGEANGPDLFFHYDPAHGLREVRLGREDAAQAAARDPVWAINHESLASVLFRAGDPARAADEYEKVGQLPSRGDALVAAAVCRDLAGDAAGSQALIDRAARSLGKPVQVVADSARKLRERVLEAQPK